MNDYDYQCPKCQGEDITFIELYPKTETVDFWCHHCKQRFTAKEKIPTDGIYKQSEVSALADRYPPK